MSESTVPEPIPPAIWCDFNACGWSGEEDDDCYYVLDGAALKSLPACTGLTVFLFEEEDISGTEILGRVARLERYGDSWRARPVGDWFRGTRPW